MHHKPFRFYLRAKWTSIPVFTFGFMAIMFASAVVTTHDSSRVAFVYPMALFCLLTYLSLRAGLAWIRVLGNGEEIVSVPCWYARKILGEKGKTAKILPDSELVFCRRMAYGILDGYYITLRAKDGSEQVLWNSINGISRRRRMRIAEELEQRFKLRVRQVRQDLTPGRVAETEWTGKGDKRIWKNIGMGIILTLIPWLGIAVRLLTANPQAIAWMGAVLWICGAATHWLIFRISRVQRDQSLPLTIFVWTMTYIPFYLIAVFGTSALLKR